MIDANSDDLQMHFQLETDPTLDCGKITAKTCNSLGVHRMPLREGYYVFIRNEDRSALNDLTHIRICKEQGILCTDAPLPTPWREKTWLLVRVAREDSDAALAQETAQNLAGLLDALNANRSLIGNDAMLGVPDAIKALLDNAIKVKAVKKTSSTTKSRRQP
ncbi:MAG: hypothetical protein ACRC0J_07205 [Shewanella oncorhynchi]